MVQNVITFLLDLTIKDILIYVKNFLYNPVIASIVGGILGIIITKAASAERFFSQHKKYWFLNEQDPIYFYTGSIPGECNSASVMQIGDIKSFALILGTVKTLYPDIDTCIRIADHHQIDISGKSIISIGGSRWNSVTKRLYHDLTWPFKIKRNKEGEAFIFDPKTQKEYHLKRDAAGEVIEVYGLFLKGLNPMSPTKFVYVISGLSTYGVLCVTKFFSIIEPFEKIKFRSIRMRAFFGSNLFAALIRSKVSNGQVFNPELVLTYKISSDEMLK